MCDNGAGWMEDPKSAQVVLVFMTLLRSVHLEGQGGVGVCVYCLNIAFSLVKKEYLLFFGKKLICCVSG